MSKWSLLAAALCAVVFAAVSAGPAFAGEVNGNGDPTGVPEHANSICAFSGQNDGEPPPGRTQSYGQDNKAGRSDPSSENPGKVGQGNLTFHPGFACNGNHGFFAGG
ncbi:MAG: hypothetical protein ACRDQT_01955 [Gaiellaceae bacterium]